MSYRGNLRLAERIRTSEKAELLIGASWAGVRRVFSAFATEPQLIPRLRIMLRPILD